MLPSHQLTERKENSGLGLFGAMLRLWSDAIYQDVTTPNKGWF